MKRNLLKLTLFCLCCFSVSAAFGQWSKNPRKKNVTPPLVKESPKYKIFDNKLENAENLQFILNPFYWSGAIMTDVSLKLEGHYRKNNQWSIGGFVAKSYHIEQGGYSQSYLASISGEKKPIRIGITGNYYFKNKKKEREFKYVVESKTTGIREITNYYVPIKGYKYHLMGLRGGYSLFSGTIDATYILNSEIAERRNGNPNATFGTLHIGIARMKIIRMDAKVYGYKRKRQKKMGYIYSDILLNTNTSFDKNLTLKDTPTEVAEWATLPIGFRIGFKRFPTRKLDFHYGVELGMKPGPVLAYEDSIKYENSLFLNFGIGIGFGTLLK